MQARLCHQKAHGLNPNCAPVSSSTLLNLRLTPTGSWKHKYPTTAGLESISIRLAATAAELLLELVHPSCRIDKSLLTCICRMRIHCNVTDDHIILHIVDRFFPVTLHRRTCQKLLTARYVDETYGIQCWMGLGFHGQ